MSQRVRRRTSSSTSRSVKFEMASGMTGGSLGRRFGGRVLLGSNFPSFDSSDNLNSGPLNRRALIFKVLFLRP